MELEFTALENDPAVMVQIFISGNGSFFVDDILLQEMDERFEARTREGELRV